MEIINQNQKKRLEDENELSSSGDIIFNPPLYIQRYQMVSEILSNNIECQPKVADFGCSEGKLLRRLKNLSDVEEIACIDCDDFAIEQCLYEARPLTYDILFGRPKELTINVYKGSVDQKDSRLKYFDAITCIELIEHLECDVLSRLPQNIFGYICPKLVVISTPNAEYNVLFPELKNSSKLRHWDHKFEWTRTQFDNWCQTIVDKYPDYSYETTGVGNPPPGSPNVGFCTQMAIFKRNSNDLNNNRDNERSDNYLNYKLIDSFVYQKSKTTGNECSNTEQTYVDWDSVLN